MPSPFEPRGSAAVRQLTDAYPLALLVSSRLNTSPLPLIAETDDRGTILSLFGHCARANPLVADFQADPHGLAIFTGPAGYVSPALVSKPDWGPTWNYAMLRFRVEVAFVPEETARSIDLLVAKMEGDAWSTERLGVRYEPMLSRIIAFRAHVTGANHVFKLGQDESPQVHGEIVARHPDRVLAQWMEEQGKP